jgi:hypothetical protein
LFRLVLGLDDSRGSAVEHLAQARERHLGLHVLADAHIGVHHRNLPHPLELGAGIRLLRLSGVNRVGPIADFVDQRFDLLRGFAHHRRFGGDRRRGYLLARANDVRRLGLELQHQLVLLAIGKLEQGFGQEAMQRAILTLPVNLLGAIAIRALRLVLGTLRPSTFLCRRRRGRGVADG